MIEKESLHFLILFYSYLWSLLEYVYTTLKNCWLQNPELTKWLLTLRIHCRLWRFQKLAKKCMKWIFFICKSKYTVKVYSIHYKLGQNTDVKKISFEQTKNAFFVLSRATTHHSFTFNSRFLHELKHKVHLFKRFCRIFHFIFGLIFN